MAEPGERPSGRSWLQRILIAFNLVLITVVVAGAGGGGYLYWQFDHIDRVPIGKGFLAPEAASGAPENYLLVGTDAAGGSGHSATPIIVRVDPRTEQAAMISFPRDLWVKIPGLDQAPKNTT